MFRYYSLIKGRKCTLAVSGHADNHSRINVTKDGTDRQTNRHWTVATLAALAAASVIKKY